MADEKKVPKFGYIVAMAQLPNCQLCDKGRTAHYDGKTFQGPWAYMCRMCWTQYGPGKTGVGFGQEMIVVESESE